MSYNGSGTFVVNSAGQPVVTGTVISSTAFNALTADLATGLSTAITKDGQTTTTVRVPFAAGISSTLVTDATSALTGSIITAGGISMQKALWVGTTSRLVGNVQADGLVGIGRSPAYKLHVSTGSATSVIASFTDSVNQGVHIGTTTTGVYFNQENSGFLGFQIGGTERARIGSDGSLLVGTTTNGGFLGNASVAVVAASTTGISCVADGGSSLAYVAEVNSTGALFMDFRYNGTTRIGSIGNTSGTTTTYNTSSDKNLKDYISQHDNGDIFDRIEWNDYTWKSAPDAGVFVGPFAQDLHKVIPNSIRIGVGLPGDENFQPWQVDYTCLVPYLGAEVKSLRARVATLEARLTALEAK